jgi:uncharacterized protein (DUF58 family)
MTFEEWLTRCETTLEIATSSQLQHLHAGMHRSVHLGKGLRLRHHDAYRPGDPRSAIDWKVSRKENTLLLRRFEEEKQLEVMLLCDVSASMQFGRQEHKHRLTVECAGLVGLAALQQGNTFGVIAFAEDMVAHFPPQQHRRAVLQALEYLWHYQPPVEPVTTTMLAPALRYLPTTRSVLALIVSDFRMPDWQEALGNVSALHDTVPILIADEAEETLAPLGHIVVHDLESGQFVELDTSSASYRQAYQAQRQAERASRERLFQQYCGEYIVTSHATEAPGELLQLFLARAARAWT